MRMPDANDTLTEADAGLPDDLDDDELLHLGNDFNILEYADPELELGDKNNIFDEHIEEMEKTRRAAAAAAAAAKANSSDPNAVPGVSAPTPGSSDATAGPVVPPVDPSQQPPPYVKLEGRSLQPPPPPYDPSGGLQSHPQAPQHQPPSHSPQMQSHAPQFQQQSVHEQKPVIEEQFGSVGPSPAGGEQQHSFLSDYDFERLKADVLSDVPEAGDAPLMHQHQQQFGQQPGMQAMPHMHHHVSGPHMHQQGMQPQPQWQQQPPHDPQSMPPNARFMHHQQQHVVQQRQQFNPQMMSRTPGHAMIPNQMQRQMPPQQQLSPSPQQQQSPGIVHQHPAFAAVGQRPTPRVPAAGQQKYQFSPLPEPPKPPNELPPNHPDYIRMAQQYESWLHQNEMRIADEQQKIQGNVDSLRKAKKKLNAMQRQQKKNNMELSDQEKAELENIGKELNYWMKGLDSMKKASRHHQAAQQEFRGKHQVAMVGAPQTAPPVLPIGGPGSAVVVGIHSPGSVGSHPRSVNSPMLNSPMMSMGHNPGTPQSPALMSPSPSPMIHSPAPGHSPSPAIQSPIYSQSARSPATPGLTGMGPHSDDSNPFADSFNKESAQRGNIPINYQSAGQPGFGPGPRHPHFQQQQQQQMRPGPQFLTQSQMMSGPQVGYQNQAAMHQMYGQQVRRGAGGPPPPPPYPGSAQYSGHPHAQQQHMQQQQHPQHQQMMQQQHHGPQQQAGQQQQGPPQMQHHQQMQGQQMMYRHQYHGPNHPPVGQQMRVASPQHGPSLHSPQHQAIPSPQHQAMPSPQQHQPMASPSGPGIHSPHNQPLPSPQHHGMQQPSPQQQQQPSTPQPPPLMPQPQSVQQSPKSQDMDSITLPLNMDGDSLDLDESVGEAKTSLTLNFDEDGLGKDVDSPNESLLKSLKESEGEVKQMSQSAATIKVEAGIVSPDDQNGPNRVAIESVVPTVEVKQESCNSSVACSSQTSSSTIIININSEPNTLLPKERKTEIEVASTSGVQISAADSEIARQNVLLKQLLQNCPSAETGTKPAAASAAAVIPVTPSSKSKGGPSVKPIVQMPTSVTSAKLPVTPSHQPVVTITKVPMVQTPLIVPPVPGPRPGDAAIVAANVPAGLQVSVVEPKVEPMDDVVMQDFLREEDDSNDDHMNQMNEIHLKVERDVVEINCDPSPNQDSSSQGSLISPEKKMSYLDIRRAQLEKEPTPPPEAKPKRKKSTAGAKRKDSGAPCPAPTTGTKKRQRKTSAQAKPDENYQHFIDNVMMELRKLPPMPISEPRIKPNFNICSVPGAGDLNNLTTILRGEFGAGYIPAGAKNTGVGSKSASSGNSCGFYNQEFAKGSKLCLNPNEYSCILRDTDSPESIVNPSPECVQYEDEPLAFGVMRVISEQEEDEINNNDNKSDHEGEKGRSNSPVIPLLIPLPTRFESLDHEVLSPTSSSDSDPDRDKENTIAVSTLTKGSPVTPPVAGPPLRENAGNVAVTLTLSGRMENGSGPDIQKVLTALAKLLDMETPTEYSILDENDLPSSPISIDMEERKDDADHDMSSGGQFCRFCEVRIPDGKGITKKVSELRLKELKCDPEEDEIRFCDTNCFLQFAITLTPESERSESGPVVSHKKTDGDDIISDIKPFLPPLSPMMEDDDDGRRESTAGRVIEHREPLAIIPDDHSMPPVLTPGATPNQTPTHTPGSWTDDVLSKLPPNFDPSTRKWKGIKYKNWTARTFVASNPVEEDQEEINQLLDNLEIALKSDELPEDSRHCSFCHGVGDGASDGPGRLLNYDIDRWVHLNCALWSTKVYETVNGALMLVDVSLQDASLIPCSKCNRMGASMKCWNTRCKGVFHLNCALDAGCIFMQDKSIFCQTHAPKPPKQEMIVTNLSVFRRVYVNRPEQKQLENMVQDQGSVMRVGNMVLLSMGQLLPQQLSNFHSPTSIYPIGYRIARFYWSRTQLGKRKKYLCSIHEKDGFPEFVIEEQDRGVRPKSPVLVSQSNSPRLAWREVIEPIARMNQEQNNIKVFVDQVTGDDLFGLNELTVIRILESMHGVDTLSDYSFRFNRNQLIELPLAINPTGCARTEPYHRSHCKRPHAMHTSSPSRSSIQSFSPVEVQSPYVKTFVHSKPSMYRKMKTEWRNNVYLARSRIAGLGLFAARNMDRNTMVIEYIGQLIRNEIAERNEKLYEQQVSHFIRLLGKTCFSLFTSTPQNRSGIYMFRLDENTVIDATLCGGLARYINHSCNPNCVAESVQIDRENRIIIFAKRDIAKGEEVRDHHLLFTIHLLTHDPLFSWRTTTDSIWRTTRRRSPVSVVLPAVASG